MNIHVLSDRSPVLGGLHVYRASESALPEDERRQVVVVPHVESRPHRLIGLRGGQGRSGADLDADLLATLVPLVGAALVVVVAVVRSLA